MEQPLDPLAEWASVLFSALADSGVTELVVSPGSRSTPFLLAAAREPRLVLHDVIDERAAAFFALGLVRNTGRPAALLCTSGSAPAHWLPAVIEASRAFLPLVLLTADRPPELQENGAAQTVDQTKLFGDHVRLFLDAGLPDARETLALRGLRRMSAQLVAAARHPTPGPVHLNLRARKPLEPRRAAGEAESAFAQAARSVRARRAPAVLAARAAPERESLRAIAALLSTSERGLIVAGAGSRSRPSPASLARLAELTGFALLCDATSNLRTADCAGALAVAEPILSSPALAAARPELILQLGPAPLSSRWESLCDAPSISAHVVIAEHGWQDPANSATHVLSSPLDEAVDGLNRILESRGPRPSQLARALAALDRSAQRDAAQLLEDGRLSEAAVARALVANGAEGSALVVGNSLPIRMVEAWAASRARASRSSRSGAPTGSTG